MGAAMENIVILAVIGAAFLHAFWNFLLKGNHDKALSMYAVTAGHLPIAMVGMVWAGLPPMEALPFILISGGLHTGYQIFLMNAYRFGALSNIYPIARGLSPLLLALASLFMAEDQLSRLELLGILMVAGALIVFGMAQYRFDKDGPMGMFLAMMTGLFIASYSLTDALGTRVTGSAFSYYGAMSLVNVGLFTGYFMLYHRDALRRLPTEGRKMLIIGGTASYLAYVMVLWACLTLPVAIVSSLRETSVLIALILGVVFLKEKLTWAKMLACLAVVSGIALMRLG